MLTAISHVVEESASTQYMIATDRRTNCSHRAIGCAVNSVRLSVYLSVCPGACHRPVLCHG